MTSSAQSQNLLLAALPADDFELLRRNLQLIDLARGMVLGVAPAILRVLRHRGTFRTVLELDSWDLEGRDDGGGKRLR
jgi:hypothetical protein